MKKVLSLILVAVMLVSVFTISAYAEPEYDVSDYKYYDKAVEFNYGIEPWYYDELYYHYSDENSEEPDWALVYIYTDVADMRLLRYGVVVENMAICTQTQDMYSNSRHYVYVSALDKFLYVEYSQIEEVLENCPDFVEVIEENNYGQRIGDINDDFIVNILDATYIQRLLAGYKDTVSVRLVTSSKERRSEYVDTVDTIYANYVYVDGKWHWEYAYISDFNRDGERTILDATAIQMKLAKIEDTATE